MHHLYVLTGGPGSGKTSLLDAAQAAGFSVVPEAGRRIIREQTASGGTALPWAGKAAFRDLMLDDAIRTHSAASAASAPVLFDRGVVDVLGYSRLEGLDEPDRLARALRDRRYNPQVFIAPPWEAIYARDSERKQSFEVAVATYEAMVSAYREADYELAELPRDSVGMRLEFLKGRIAAGQTVHM